MVLHPRSGYLHLRFMRRLRETQTLKAGGARRAPPVFSGLSRCSLKVRPV
jgi:hypothetical protein